MKNLPKTRQSRPTKIGSTVKAHNFQNIEIIGIYRGQRSSFGVLVWGRPTNSHEPPTMYECRKLTMVPLVTQKPKTKQTATNRVFRAGDRVLARNSADQLIQGIFSQYQGKWAWIKPNNSTAVKVARESLLPLTFG